MERGAMLDGTPEAVGATVANSSPADWCQISQEEPPAYNHKRLALRAQKTAEGGEQQWHLDAWRGMGGGGGGGDARLLDASGWRSGGGRTRIPRPADPTGIWAPTSRCHTVARQRAARSGHGQSNQSTIHKRRQRSRAQAKNGLPREGMARSSSGAHRRGRQPTRGTAR